MTTINQTTPPVQTHATPCVVVMAKHPAPGRVKTRLTPDYSPHQAACIHAAMLDCVLTRLLTHLPGRHILALDHPTNPQNTPPEQPDPELAFQIPHEFQVIDQGQGDLGDRLNHVWHTINTENTPEPAAGERTQVSSESNGSRGVGNPGGGGGRTVFFGTDSPDIPPQTLKNIFPTLDHADATIGPVSDGGYYCLATNRPAPQLLSGIDWGTEAVYHQTHNAAQNAGLKLLDLTPWHDVDTPTDLLELQHRLKHTNEPTLTRLSQRLHRITQDTTR